MADHHAPLVDGHNRRAFLLSKEILVEAAQPVATVAVVTTCTSLILAQQVVDANNPSPRFDLLLTALPFCYLPFGLAGLILCVAVRKNPGFVGFTSGFLLGHLLLAIMMGGLVNGLNLGIPWVAGVLSILICILTVMLWSILCSYPKFVSTGLPRIIRMAERWIARRGVAA